MKKTFLHISIFLLCLFSTAINAKVVLQPTNGNSISITVVSGDVFYDSGGPGGSTNLNNQDALGNYINCIDPTDNAATCTNKITLCGSGVVCLNFSQFQLFGGNDALTILNGGINGPVLASGNLKNQLIQSTDATGCLTAVFHGTSIGNAMGWQAEITVKPGSVRNHQGECHLICNDHVNASMPADQGVCKLEFEAEDFLNNASDCDYKVILAHPFGTNTSVENGVDRSHIGYTMVYKVMAPNLNSCWGYVTVEDKAPPIGICKNRKISCFQIDEIEAELGNVIDNCAEATPPAKIEKLTIIPQGNGCDQLYIAKVARTIRTWDVWGNTGICFDTLSITRDSLKNVKCPDLVPLECMLSISSSKRTALNKLGASVVSITGSSPAWKLVFSKEKGTPNYPTPDLLLALQAQGCIPADTLVVPSIWDSVFTIEDGQCVAERECIPMWPAIGGVCKTTLGYTDEVLTICGNGFKIRRQWRIANWCTGKDTVCVQYIKVEDTQAPMITKTPEAKIGVGSPHDCYAPVSVGAYEFMDCSPVNQKYILSYADAGHPGKTVVLAGTLPTTSPLKIPALANGCAIMDVSLVDACYNTTTDKIAICVEDKTPPNPVCDEFTQTTVDPNTCWARVYAHDLDNGSRDNCCNVLHFAVAHMDSITKYRNLWTSYWETNCKADYWKYKNYIPDPGFTGYGYDGFLEDWINAYVFKDYIDLTECGNNQVVLRVYEACGVPRYDPHIFPCSQHDWFIYNSYGLWRSIHNIAYFGKAGKANPANKTCNYTLPIGCRADIWKWWLNMLKDDSTVNGSNDQEAFYPGAIPFANLPDNCPGLATLKSFLSRYFPDPFAPLNTSGYNPAPGNRCSKRLYNDCMVNILVDDKTPPVCEGPNDIYWYCDGAGGANAYSDVEYADDYCDDSDGSYGDYSCYFESGKPYNNIESIKENDATISDTLDGTKVKSFGWYGCATGIPGHVDEHGGDVDACRTGNEQKNGNANSKGSGGGWSPIYCRSWLILDSFDRAGKIDPRTAFSKPVLRSMARGEDAAAGEFIAWDNCWIKPTFDVANEEYIDRCGNGWLKRTWTFYDKCDNKVVCDQKIFTYHRSDFEVMFPADLTQTCEGDNTNPDITGRPMVMDDECELVGVNYTDVRYDVVADACYKIVRTWTLIDWCKYDANKHRRDPDVIVDDRFVADPANRYCVFRKLKDDGDGYMTYTQIIKVVDNIAPETSCKDTSICYYGGWNGAGLEPTGALCSFDGYKSPDFTGTDNCTPANQISFRYEIDTDSKGNKDHSKATINRKSGPNVKRYESIPGELFDGVHTLYVIAEDNCGKEDTFACLITIQDCKKPTPYCYNGIATVVMPSSKSVEVWAKDLDAGSYDNCTKRVSLVFTIEQADGSKAASRKFTCDDIPNGQGATVELNIYVKDAAGNEDHCRTYVLIQDGSGNACEDKAALAASISGKVATEATEPVENVILDVKSSSAVPAFKTAANGSYAFSGLSMKGDYSIAPKRDDDPTNGVSTVDLVLIQKHILGVQPLNSAYKVIAADADRSNDVSAVDLVELRKLVLTVYDKLPNNTSWRFVPKAYSFSNIQNPWGFPEKLDINGLSKDEIARDFVGVKVGDVNGNVVPHSLLGAEAREVGGTLKFRTLDRTVKAGEETTIEFTAENFNNIEGYQFSMALRGLELKSVKGGKLNVSESNFGMTKLGSGYLTTSWNDSKAVSISNTDVLFSMTVKATKATTISEALVINSKYTRAEAYNGTESLGISLEVGKKSVAGYTLNQNTPNPFKSSTVISYELAKSESVTVKITDVTGKVVRMYNRDGQKGYNQLTVNRSDISGAGVLYYTVETKDFSATKKMIVIE